MILYAIPSPIGATPQASLPAPALATIRSLKDFVVENAKSARAFLGALGMPVRELNIVAIDEPREEFLPVARGRSQNEPPGRSPHFGYRFVLTREFQG